MNWDMVAAIGALGAAIMATIGLLLTWSYRRQDRLFRIKRAVAKVITALDKSLVYKIPPHHEHWVDGFASLDETRDIIADSKEILIAGNAGESTAFMLLTSLERAHQNLVSSRDSLNKYIEKTGYPSSGGWPDVGNAEQQLALLQREVMETMPRLRSLIDQLKK